MHKAYLVIGGESTGTRLMTRILIDAGCFGDSTHKQCLDDNLAKYVPNAKPLVWRRSFPHQGKMPDLQILFEALFDVGIEDIFVVVTTRNWLCAAQSAVKAGHAHSIGHALANLEEAYITLFETLSDFNKIPYHLVSYEFLIKGQALYIKYLLEQMGLELTGKLTKINDENSKYIREALSVERKITE